ncbi:hypothetical protein BgiBS90_031674, partial [Biomphalaria glabrata]
MSNFIPGEFNYRNSSNSYDRKDYDFSISHGGKERHKGATHTKALRLFGTMSVILPVEQCPDFDHHNSSPPSGKP